MSKRGSGILLHVTSLPSPYGIGDLGPSAYKFADFLGDTRQSYWQVLPLNPTDPINGNSPYSSQSAFASNPLLISPDLLVNQGWLRIQDLEPIPAFSADQVDFPAVIAYKSRLLELAFHRFRETEAGRELARFGEENASWLHDYAIFVCLKDQFGGRPWNEWPPELRDRVPSALAACEHQFKDRIAHEKFTQFALDRQWRSLKRYCNRRGIMIVGDLPIYVNYDSADVWSHPQLFKLDRERRPAFVAGVPPDYFSATGQLWGNPVYDWDALRETRYSWWVERMERTLGIFDQVRIDHFRGLVAYWEVPAREPTAVNGVWVKTPAGDFFHELQKRFFRLPILAEDLGIITPEVRETMHNLGIPGMKVLLFAFSEDHPMHPYLPHTYPRDCLAYTGTHDNNTTRGWFETEASAEDKRRLSEYLGAEVQAETVHWDLIRLAMMSVADMVIFPVQDLIGLDAQSRMNTPATSSGNWGFRLRPEMLLPKTVEKLRRMTRIYGRA
jgi:4-alpha-glucanotransferase